MGQQHVRPEHPERAQVHDGSTAGPRKVRGGIARGGGEVEREPDTRLPGQVPGGDGELVAHQVVADEGHPTGDAGVVDGEVEDVALAVQHLRDRPRPRLSGHVPPPGPEGPAHAHRVEPGEHPVGVGDAARLDRERDPVAGRLDEGEGGRKLVVVGGVGPMGGHRPLEDRSSGGQVVGDHGPDEAVPGEVLVGVDQTGERQVAMTADRSDGVVAPRDLGGGADGHDATVTHGHGPVGDRLGTRRHGEHAVGEDDEVDRHRGDRVGIVGHGVTARPPGRGERTAGQAVSPGSRKVRAACRTRVR